MSQIPPTWRPALARAGSFSLDFHDRCVMLLACARRPWHHAMVRDGRGELEQSPERTARADGSTQGDCSLLRSSSATIKCVRERDEPTNTELFPRTSMKIARLLGWVPRVVLLTARTCVPRQLDRGSWSAPLSSILGRCSRSQVSARGGAGDSDNSDTDTRDAC